MTSRPQQEGLFGQEQIASGNSGFNAMSFMINQFIGRINVATLVRVEAVNTGGRTAAVGTVDITPLVNQRAGDGSLVEHTTLNEIPFMRIQGGSNAVICDPKVGDIGFCVFSDRDISSVKVSMDQAPPGSLRRFDYADALYVGGWMSTTAPSRYIVIDDDGLLIEANGQTTIEMDSALSKIAITANDLEVTCANSAKVTAQTVEVICVSTATITSISSIALIAPLITANGMVIT